MSRRKRFYNNKIVEPEQKFCTYLAGPIGVTPRIDYKSWRDKISVSLSKLGIETLNPVGRHGDRLGDVRKKMCKWNEDGNISAIRKNSSKKIIPPDLEMVEKSSFLTVWIPVDDGYEICGTYGEVTLSFYLNIPVYVVTNRCLKPNMLPQWLIGCSSVIFNSWEDYLNFIKLNYCGN